MHRIYMHLPIVDDEPSLYLRTQYSIIYIEMRRMVPAMFFRKNVYSQNGEDGVLRELLRRFPSRTYWACEFGTLDGKQYSNTFRLVEQEGYNAVYIEQDDTSFQMLLKTCSEYPKVLPLHRSVGYEG